MSVKRSFTKPVRGRVNTSTLFCRTTDQDYPVFAYTFSIDAFITRLHIFLVRYENLFNVQDRCLSRQPDLIRIRAIHSCQF